MPYHVQVHDAAGAPVGRPLAIEVGGIKAALVAARIADQRTGGHSDIHGPSGQFITSTRPGDRQEEINDDRD